METCLQTCDAVDFEGREVSTRGQRVPELAVGGGRVIGIGCPHLHYFGSYEDIKQ